MMNIKKETARRWIKRNKWNIAKAFVYEHKKVMKRYRECVAILKGSTTIWRP